MAVKLNDRRIAALKSPTLEQRQRDYWDTDIRGFGVRVSFGGKKVFVLRYRFNGRLRRMTIAPYPDMSLADARRRAHAVLGDVAHGNDPAQEKQELRGARVFSDLYDAYAKNSKPTRRRWDEEERIIEKDLLPALKNRPLVEIRRHELRELVENIATKRKAPVMANRTLGVLSRIFNFAVEREWLDASPASRIAEPGQERSRDRVLTDDEVKLLWAKCEELQLEKEQAAAAGSGKGNENQRRPRLVKGTRTKDTVKRKYERVTPSLAAAFQVQLLTAQRPGEVRGMKWAHVDLDAGWWVIPAVHAKNGHPHRVPLTAGVVEIMNRLKAKASEHSIFVFENHTGGGSVVHRGKKAAAILSRQLPFAFRAHDLRRTAATAMAKAGVLREHISKVLNHVEDGPSATRVYDRYQYDAEKRAALDAVAKRVHSLVRSATEALAVAEGPSASPSVAV